MKESRKKYPIMTYLLALLVIAVMFTGVTLSRYVHSSGGGAQTTVSPFICSYSIDGISAVSFSNSNYWLQSSDTQSSKKATNAARTVRYSVKNYRTDDEGNISAISDLDLQSTLRLRLPAAFADALAIQVVELDTSDNIVLSTQQYPLAELLYDTATGTDATGAVTKTRTYKTFGEIDTADFSGSKDYGEEKTKLNAEEIVKITSDITRTDGKLSGSLKALCYPYETTEIATGGTTQTVGTEPAAELTVSAETKQAEYTLAFSRGTSIVIDNQAVINKHVTPLYMNLFGDVDFYTVDVKLPSMLMKGNEPVNRTFLLHLTLVEKISTALSDDGTKNLAVPESWQNYIKGTQAMPTEQINGAKVVGYSFDLSDAIGYTLDETNTLVAGEKASLRIAHVFDGNGGDSTQYHMITTSGTDNVFSVVSPITGYYTHNLTAGKMEEAASAPTDWKGMRSYYLTAGAAQGIYYKIGETSSDNPIYQEMDANGVYTTDKCYTIGNAVERGYALQANVLFRQASEIPSSYAAVDGEVTA